MPSSGTLTICRVAPVEAARRVLRILVALSDQPVLDLATLSRRLGLPKSTVRRLVHTLQGEGFVVEERIPGRYRLSLKVVGLAGRVLWDQPLPKIAIPVMRRVRDNLKDTVFLNMLQDDSSIVVQKVDGVYPVRTVVEIGSRKPLYSGAGSKVLLAFSDDAALLNRVIAAGLKPFTEHTVRNSKELRDELSRVRARGYCVAVEDHVVGSTAVSVPIWDRSRRLMASLSVAGVTPRYGPDRLPQIISILRRAAGEISDAGILTEGAAVELPYAPGGRQRSRIRATRNLSLSTTD